MKTRLVLFALLIVAGIEKASCSILADAQQIIEEPSHFDRYGSLYLAGASIIIVAVFARLLSPMLRQRKQHEEHQLFI